MRVVWKSVVVANNRRSFNVAAELFFAAKPR
jgi:hypothetical protein